MGRLGYGNTEDVGDDETPDDVGDVDVGGVAIQLAAGRAHTCALLDTGSVRCWGSGVDGRLGNASDASIGDDETPAEVGDVDVGGIVTQIEAGDNHSCAALQGGGIRCWGTGWDGQLGYGNTETYGDDELPSSAELVDVGGPVAQLAAGGSNLGVHTCALLEDATLRCWGSALYGQLGYGNTSSIGDSETPASAGPVPVF